jgi:hypothetical protein
VIHQRTPADSEQQSGQGSDSKELRFDAKRFALAFGPQKRLHALGWIFARGKDGPEHRQQKDHRAEFKRVFFFISRASGCLRGL